MHLWHFLAEKRKRHNALKTYKYISFDQQLPIKFWHCFEGVLTITEKADLPYALEMSMPLVSVTFFKINSTKAQNRL